MTPVEKLYLIVVVALFAVTFFVIYTNIAGEVYRKFSDERWPRIIAFAVGLLWPVLVVAVIIITPFMRGAGVWKDEP